MNRHDRPDPLGGWIVVMMLPGLPSPEVFLGDVAVLGGYADPVNVSQALLIEPVLFRNHEPVFKAGFHTVIRVKIAPAMGFLDLVF